MSNNIFDGRAIDNAEPELMREELDKYFAHVQQYDSKSLKFAIMIAGHGEANGDINVCSMVGGPPQAIARITAELMGELSKNDPELAKFFLISFLQHVRGHQGINVEVVDINESADAKAQVKDLISTPPSKSVH